MSKLSEARATHERLQHCSNVLDKLNEVSRVKVRAGERLPIVLTLEEAEALRRVLTPLID